MARSSWRNLDMLEKICGNISLPNVILATTMWDKVDESSGKSREEELRTRYWKAMIMAGARTTRFKFTYESAWEIIAQFKGYPLAVQLQEEMVDRGMELGKTSAGSTLLQFQDKLIAHLREMIRKLELQLWGISNSNTLEALLHPEQLDMRRKLDQLVEQKEKLAKQLKKSHISTLSPPSLLSLGPPGLYSLPPATAFFISPSLSHSYMRPTSLPLSSRLMPPPPSNSGRSSTDEWP
jgi:hypothetical protein